MTFLGDFGEEREPLDLEFGWCGERFRVHPDATDLGFMEFMTSAEEIQLPADVDMDSLAADPSKAIAVMNSLNTATQSMHRFIRGQIHPDDWERFMSTAKAKRQQTSDLMRLSHNLTAAIARFPTGQSSDSAPSPSSVSKKSSGGSSSAGKARNRALSSRESPATQRRHKVEDDAAKLLAGRPDLRLLLWEQSKARDAEEQAA